MKRYLLGNLEADRRTELEEEILCDPDVYEELLLSEEDLIDQYVADGLSGTERQQFETHFLITAERQKNLRFGKLLKRYVTSHPDLISQQKIAAALSQARDEAPAKPTLPFYQAPFRKRAALTFSALIVVFGGIILLCWLAVKKPGDRAADHRIRRLVVITLAPGSIRSGGETNRVNAPPKDVNVKFELELANSAFKNYKSQLFRAAESLEIRNDLKMESKGDQHVVPLTITGEILSPGDYQVKLSGVLESGVDEFIDNYSFRVIE